MLWCFQTKTTILLNIIEWFWYGSTLERGQLTPPTLYNVHMKIECKNKETSSSDILSIFLDWAFISNRRQVFHNVWSNMNYFGKIGWALPMSPSRLVDRRCFFLNLNNSFLDRNFCLSLFVPILQVGIVEY
jgi:hypothetical protein